MTENEIKEENSLKVKKKKKKKNILKLYLRISDDVLVCVRFFSPDQE